MKNRNSVLREFTTLETTKKNWYGSHASSMNHAELSPLGCHKRCIVVQIVTKCISEHLTLIFKYTRTKTSFVVIWITIHAEGELVQGKPENDSKTSNRGCNMEKERRTSDGKIQIQRNARKSKNQNTGKTSEELGGTMACQTNLPIQIVTKWIHDWVYTLSKPTVSRCILLRFGLQSKECRIKLQSTKTEPSIDERKRKQQTRHRKKTIQNINKSSCNSHPLQEKEMNESNLRVSER